MQLVRKTMMTRKIRDDRVINELAMMTFIMDMNHTKVGSFHSFVFHTIPKFEKQQVT